MSKFSGLLSPSSQAALSLDVERSAARAAALAAQMGLWRRLSPGRSRSDAGRLAWMLVRLAQPGHRDHADACAEVDGIEAAALTPILAAARATADGARGPARELAARVAWRLDPERDPLAYDPEGQAMRTELSGIQDLCSPRARELIGVLDARMRGAT